MSSAPNFLFMPLNEHFDGGLGATADAFKEAADELAEGANNILNGHLPINFLYRHAIELYMKSVIVVLHRALEIPYYDQPFESEPRVPIRGRWKNVYTVHSVKALYDHMSELISSYASRLAAVTKTDWSTVPGELQDWIEEIDVADSSSTLFRYPSNRSEVTDAISHRSKQLRSRRFLPAWHLKVPRLTHSSFLIRRSKSLLPISSIIDLLLN